MKQMLTATLVIGLGVFAYLFLTQPADPLKARREAQTSANKVIRYWLAMGEAGNVGEMQAVCAEMGARDTEAIVKKVNEEMIDFDLEWNQSHYESMGGGGAVMAFFMDKDDGLIGKGIVTTKEIDDKYWIVRANWE